MVLILTEMKPYRIETSFTERRAVFVALAASSFICFASQMFAAAQVENLEDQETIACRRNLLLISDGLREYERTHKQVPDWLSGLLPDYGNPEFLTCPTARRTGRTSLGQTGRNVVDPSFPTSYVYEFNPAPASGAEWRGLTDREKMKRQMEQYGPGVPIVRCLYMHSTNLNLSLTGEIYESPLYWESQHSSRLDLSRFFNASLTNWWPGQRDGLSGLSTGWQKLGGVKFSIGGGLVQLASSETNASLFPRGVDSIRVGLKTQRLHLLHGCMGSVPDNTEIARLTLHFEKTNRTETIPLRYGVHMVDSWGKSETPASSSAVLAWPETNSSTIGPRHGRLYHATISNPVPANRITTIDYASSLSASAPFLIAITLEP